MRFRGKDFENRNLYLRGRFYWVNFKTCEGKRYFISTETDDIAKAREIRDERLKGIGPMVTERLTVERAINLYLTERKELGEKIPERAKRSLHDDELVLKRFQNYIGKDRDIKSLDDNDFDGFEVWLIDNFPRAKSIHRRNRHFKILNIFFNRCVRRRRMKFNPILAYLDELQTEEKRDRYASVSEYSRLLTVCSDPQNKFNPLLRPIIETLAITGLRLGDVLGLAWDNVDFNAGEIRIVQMKTRKKHVVPIGERLSTILQAIPSHMDSPYIFNVVGKRVNQNGWLRGEFAKAKRMAGIADFRFHDLRRTTATHSQDDSSMDAIQKTIGHATPSMTRRYVIERTDIKKRVQNSLVERLYSDCVTKSVTIDPSVTPAFIEELAKADDGQSEVSKTGVAEWQTRQTQNPTPSPTEDTSSDGKPPEPT